MSGTANPLRLGGVSVDVSGGRATMRPRQTEKTISMKIPTTIAMAPRTGPLIPRSKWR